MWLSLGAIGLAGFGLSEWGSHAHDDGHHHHSHEHTHGGTTHSHHHSHDEHDGHAREPSDNDNDHHNIIDHGNPDPVILTVPPRETRRVDDVETISIAVVAPATADCRSVALPPPRSPPRASSGQDALPHLRTIVLLT